MKTFLYAGGLKFLNTPLKLSQIQTIFHKLFCSWL